MLERMARLIAWVFRHSVTIPDGDGGRITYFPDGGYSHKL